MLLGAVLGAAGIRFYQRHLSHRLNKTCWQRPTCSQYGLEAVQRYGFRRGIVLAADRVQSCTTENREAFYADRPESDRAVRRYDPVR